MERDLDAFPSPDELWGRLKGTLKLESEKDESDALLPSVLDRAFKGEL